jgi:hypothetical protein
MATTTNNIRQDVEAAQTAILRTAATSGSPWDPKELRDAARNGWSGDVMMFALTDLINQGRLVLDSNLRVRVPE